MTSLPPPPRKHSSSTHGHRIPKVNPKCLATDTAVPTNDEHDLDEALAHLLNRSTLDADLSSAHHPHLPHCRYYSGPHSPSSSLDSEPHSICGSVGGVNARRASQAYLSPLSPAASDLSTATTATTATATAVSCYFTAQAHSTRPCHTCHSYSCTAVAMGEECDYAARSETAELDQASTTPCPYCSSARSNSICSAMSQEDRQQQHHHQHQHPRSQSISMMPIYDPCSIETMRSLVPSEVRRRMSYHLDECWFVHFSPSGEYLASIGRDHNINLWQDMTCPEPKVYKTFTFPRTVTAAEWSPDSKYLLVNLGYDHNNPEFKPDLKLIDVKSGEILFSRTCNGGDGLDVYLNAIGWLPDSKRFLTAGDNGTFTVWDVRGNILREYVHAERKRVVFMKMIPGKDETILVTKGGDVESMALDANMSTRPIDQRTAFTGAISISNDGAYLVLASLADKDVCRPAQISLYDLKTMNFLRSFDADTYDNDRNLVIPMIAGPNNELVCAGSESGKIHIWDLETGELIQVLEEHSRHTGCLTAHPKYPGMIVSCSDDNCIIIWATKSFQEERRFQDENWLKLQSTIKLPTVEIKKGW